MNEFDKLPKPFIVKLKDWIDSLDDVVYVWEDSSNDKYYTFYIVTEYNLIKMFGTYENPNLSLDKVL